MAEPLVAAYFVSSGVLLMGAGYIAVLARNSYYPRASLVYAALCLAFALFQFCNGMQYGQADDAVALLMHKWVNLFSLSILALIVYMIAALNGGYRMAHLVAAVVLAAIVYNFVAPFGFRFAHLYGHAAATLPWGEKIYIFSGQQSLAAKAVGLVLPVVVVYVLLFARKLKRVGEIFSMRLFGVAAVLMFVTTSLAAAADAGLVGLPYMGGFMFLVLSLALPFLVNRDIQTRSNQQQREHVALSQELQAEQKIRDHLERLLNHDAPTGLPNRFGMLALLESLQAGARQNGSKIAMLIIELGEFDIISASQEHGAGDQLLAEAVARIRRGARDGDIVARLGVGRFAVLAPGAGQAGEALGMHQALAAAFGAPIEVSGQRIVVTCNTGAAIFPDHGASAPDLLAAAEMALHDARLRGGGQGSLFHPGLNGNVREKALFGSTLSLALEDHQFELYYQPQVGAADSKTVCMEALMRWNHPSEGLVMPARFIHLAEENGMIVPLGAWAIESACRQLAGWRALGCADVRMAVNLSARQLLTPDLTAVITLALRRHGLQASDLELEITESTLVREPESAIARLHELRALGVRLAIDDFGTGYSSLNYVRVLPVHTFKLDRCFVQDIEVSERDLAICETAIRLAANLGLEVVAEGVESAQQARLLSQLGCHLLQGYYFSQPLPAEAATRYLLPTRGSLDVQVAMS